MNCNNDRQNKTERGRWVVGGGGGEIDFRSTDKKHSKQWRGFFFVVFNFICRHFFKMYIVC